MRKRIIIAIAGAGMSAAYLLTEAAAAGTRWK
jgi:hypothetical protein